MSEKKVAIVTGGRGLYGASISEGLAEAGAQVVIASRSGAACEETAAAVRALNVQCTAVPGDIGQAETVERLFAEAHGRVDVLVNCAGVVPQGDLLTTDMSAWDAAFDTNVKAVFLTCREAVRLMRGRGDAIVNVASVAGFKGIKNRALYSATKGAVIALTKSMAAEYVGDGIRINAVSPGTVLSPSLQARIDLAEDPAAEKKMFESRQPIGRLGTPEEIAEVILFLASPANSYMTGENLVCDGGATA